MLDECDFKQIIRNSNLFAIDLVIRLENKVLLGKRKNRPAKGFYFVPGGRVHKNEHLQAAFERILLNETGIDQKHIKETKCIGLYEHIYEDNFFGDASFNTHYIVYAVEVLLVEYVEPSPDSQNEELIFFEIEELLSSTEVHQFTKNYFKLKSLNRLNL